MKKIVMIVGMGAWSWFGQAQAATIDVSTGVAAWQVARDAPVPAYSSATSLAQGNPSWAPAPAGSAWISNGASQGTSCISGQTPGSGCATALVNASGDVWEYRLTISAAQLGNTAGTFNFIFGADNRVDVYIGVGSAAQTWNSSNPLGCSSSPTPTSTGNTQATYNTCTGTFSYVEKALNNDGSLTIVAQVHNDPLSGCPTCGDPTGFLLEGTLVTNDRIFRSRFELGVN